MNTTWSTLKVFWRESMRYPKQFFGMLIGWPIAMTLQDLILPLIAAQAINKLIEVHGAGTVDYWPTFFPYLFWFIVVGAVGQIFAHTALKLLTTFEVFVRKRLEELVYDHLLKHGLSFHGNSFAGALVSQATRFANAYISIVDTFMIHGIILVVQSLVAIIIIAFFSPIIALAMFIWSVFFAWLNIFLTKRRMPASRQASAADSTVTSQLADSMGNIAAIKSFAGEQHEKQTYASRTLERAHKTQAVWNWAINNGTVTALLLVVLQFAILILSIFTVMSGQLEIGTLLLIQVYMTRLMSTLWNLGNLTKNFERSIADATEMVEVLSIKPEVQDVDTPNSLHISKGAINMRDINFAHADAKNGESLFENFSLSIKAGEKIGLVGRSGSGKTTLTKLLLRFHDVNQGEILIDDQNIAHIAQSDLRAHIAYVPQDPALFHRSLRENIAYGKLDATEEELRHAAQQAHALEFIDQLPEGLDTAVGERGVKLSGGQRQRIAIARATLKNAPILILDEATSALDSESEKLIQDALTKLMRNRTTIVIAHRLSTIQNLDRIVVLDGGKIIEQGSHTELLKKKGAYAKLWQHQSGGFLEE